MRRGCRFPYYRHAGAGNRLAHARMRSSSRKDQMDIDIIIVVAAGLAGVALGKVLDSFLMLSKADVRPSTDVIDEVRKYPARTNGSKLNPREYVSDVPEKN